jgi:hypothetical protein
MKHLFLFSMLFLLASCNNSGNSDKEVTKTNSGAAAPNQNNEIRSDLSGCYLRVLKRDTLALSIQQNGKTVTGKLSFDNFQKDGSSGIVSGTIDNNILKLIYNFQSEGMHSVMEVYFKIADSTLIHGIGEVAVKSDTAYFVNSDQVRYPEGDGLVKINCDQLDQKYK